MKLKNVLIVVRDMQRSIDFYRDLFGLQVAVDNDGNVIMTEGMVLQEIKYWESFLGKNVIAYNNSSEIYFEEDDVEAFVEKLEHYKEPIVFVNRLMKHSWGQTVTRFYDLDGNLIEVGTPMR